MDHLMTYILIAQPPNNLSNFSNSLFFVCVFCFCFFLNHLNGSVEDYIPFFLQIVFVYMCMVVIA